MKKPYQSKTIILNFLGAAGALFYPPLQQFISTHPGEIAALFSILNIALRLITKDEIYFSDDAL